jgi:hypothetical protein
MQKPIHVYLDLDAINNNLSSTAAAPVLTFQDNRNSPFLDGDSNEYLCSIIRFSKLGTPAHIHPQDPDRTTGCGPDRVSDHNGVESLWD